MFVELRDGARLHVSCRGEGPPLLLLHGFTGSGAAWGDRVLGRLAARRRVVAVDLPGHGRTRVPPRAGRYALDEVLTDLREVLDALGIRAPAWVGYSMGGRVALAAAARHPDLVDRLVLESASPGLRDPAARRARRRADEALAARIETDGIEAFVEEWTDSSLFATQRRLPARVREAVRARRLANRPERLAAVLRDLGTGVQPSFWDALPTLDAPTLLVVGGEDRKFRAIADRMGHSLRNARRVEVAGAGHTVHLEEPAAWLDAVERFLREADGGVSSARTGG